MKPFDLIITDVTTPIPYEKQTLAVQALGGTEASVIRIAEGLGELGARVGVFQHNLNVPLMGEYAFYMPMHMIGDAKCHNLVSLRGTHYLSQFPKAKKFSWHEDVPNEIMVGMREDFIKYNTTVIAASQWHKGEIQRLICDPEKQDNPRVVHIYNPIEDEIFVPKNVDVKYDNNKLCWVASPHKGFKEALEIFNNLITVSGNPNFRLYIFNPGYVMADMPELFNNRFIVDVGPIPCKDLWQHISESLCLFYPTEFLETFGNIAAEANAVHTPVLTCEIGALQETVSSRSQFVPRRDPKATIERVIDWHKGSRPKVWGQDRFRKSEVLKQWIKLLCGTFHYV